MNIELINLIQNQIIEFSNLLIKQSLHCIYLFPIILIISFLTKKKSPYWQYGLWIILFIRLILPYDFEIAGGSTSIMGEYTSPFVTEINEIKIASIISKSLPQGGFIKGSNPDNFQMSSSNITTWLFLFFIFWCCGVSLFLFVYIKRYQKFLSIIKKARIITDPKLMEIVTLWCDKLGVRQKITVISSDCFLSPFSIGTFHPKIFIPEALLNVEKQTHHSILAHEIAHIKRHDIVGMLIQNLLQIVFFFHPFVWYANSQINQARERICDHLVLRENSLNSTDYCDALIKIIKLNTWGLNEVDVVPAFISSKSKINFRLNENLKGIKLKKHSALMVFVCLVLFGFFILPMTSASVKSNIVHEYQVTSDSKDLTNALSSKNIIIKPKNLGVYQLTQQGWQIQEKESFIDKRPGLKSYQNLMRDIQVVLYHLQRGKDVLFCSVEYDSQQETIREFCASSAKKAAEQRLAG